MRRSIALLAVVGLVAAVGAAGCTSAEAEPLELTYYYLPG